jgi:hypothetical protein
MMNLKNVLLFQRINQIYKMRIHALLRIKLRDLTCLFLPETEFWTLYLLRNKKLQLKLMVLIIKYSWII